MQQVLIAIVLLVVTQLMWGWHLFQEHSLNSKKGLFLLVNVVSILLIVHFVCNKTTGCPAFVTNMW